MPWIGKFKELKSWVKEKSSFMYFFLFQIPWYRITTVVSAIYIYNIHQEMEDLRKENLSLSKIKTEMILSDAQKQKSFDELPFSLLKRVYKNNSSRISYANKSFENEFLKDHGLDRFDVTGKPIIYFWPYETSIIDQKEDYEIAKNGDRKFFSKKYLDIDSTVQQTTYWKWRNIVDTDTIIVQFFTEPYKN